MAQTVIYNLKAIRAEKSKTAPVVMDADGKRYPVGGIPLDGYLAVIEMQQSFSDQDASKTADAIPAVKALINELLPGFPAGHLTIDELMDLIGAIMTMAGPQAAEPRAEESGNGAAGELTPPSL